MEEHYTEDISLAGVAEKLGISQGYLSTMLKSSFGLGLGVSQKEYRKKGSHLHEIEI